MDGRLLVVARARLGARRAVIIGLAVAVTDARPPAELRVRPDRAVEDEPAARFDPALERAAPPRAQVPRPRGQDDDRGGRRHCQFEVARSMGAKRLYESLCRVGLIRTRLAAHG